MRFFKVLGVVALALLITGTVYAETQSVKVSGDLTIRGIYRNAYDYRGSVPESAAVAAGVAQNIVRTGRSADGGGMLGTGVYGPTQSFFMSTAEIQVDAELTDCVSTCIRILNERDWNVRNLNVQSNQSLVPNGFGQYNTDDGAFDVQLDLAYVTLKDFIYSPLTVTIGRQDLWFGKGFIVGSNHVWNNAWDIRTDTAGNVIEKLHAPEYTSMTAFDSIKAVLDYDPWTITGIYSKIMENTINGDDDVDLWGANIGYKFDCYKAEAELYCFSKIDHGIQQWNSKANNDVYTVGVRGSLDPVDSVTVALEGAFQGGKYVGETNSQGNMTRAAWACDVSGEYRMNPDQFCWKPKMGVEYILYSGDTSVSNPHERRGTYTGWDPMFRGKFDSAIREFVGSYYASYDYLVRGDYLYSSPDASFTNQQQLIFSGSIQPTDSLTIKANYNLFWLCNKIESRNQVNAATQAGYILEGWQAGFIGQELDMQYIWDYTEDVSFGLLTGWFFPGQQVYKNANKTATDIVGTVKVSF